MSLQRTLPTISLFFTAVGGIVGSGWLFGSFYAAQCAGPAAILSWILGGLLMMFLAFTFAELTTLFPVAGGIIRFAEESYGSFFSFTLGWITWVSFITVAPVETLGIIQYLASFFPTFIAKENNGHVLTSNGFLVAAGIMFLLNIFNSFGMQIYSRISSSLVVFKLLIPILTVILILIANHHHDHASIWHPFFPTGIKGIICALPLGGVIFSFIGFSTAIQLAGEAKKPSIAIPIAIIGSISFCILLYVFIQYAFINSLEPSYLIHGWPGIAFAGDNSPFASLLSILGLSFFVGILYIDAVISPMTTAFIYIASAARVSYALSLTGFFSKKASTISDKGIPIRAMVINYFAGIFLFLPFPAWQKLISFIVSAFMLTNIIAPIGLIQLRKKMPEAPRSFKVPYANLFCLITFYISNLLIFWTGWASISKLMLFLFVGMVIFFWSCVKDPEPEKWQSFRSCLWFFPYLIGMTLISYLSSFGGCNVIPFGLDFVVLGVFSVVIYFWATQYNSVNQASSSTS